MARVAFLESARRFGIALAWLLGFVAVGIGISIVLNSLSPVPPTSRWWLAVNTGGQAIGFLAATWLVGWKLNKRTWERMGWRGGASLPRGLALGAVMAAVAIGLSAITSGSEVQLTGDGERWLPIAVPLGVGLLCAALTEELVFRGYPLGRLTDAVGPWAAMALLVLPFGLLHLGNPHAGLFGALNVMFAGVWLSFAFFSPGGMGYAWSLHFGWNAGLAALFDAPVSGYRFQVPGVEYVPGARAWVDGGAFGPEGGLVATIVIIAGTLAVLGGRVRQPRTWVTG
ncbi:MAG: lysostaphin resistance A-like protein [Gemmatimonadales bacterium]